VIYPGRSPAQCILVVPVSHWIEQLEPYLAALAGRPVLQAAITLAVALLAAVVVDRVLVGGIAAWTRRTRSQIDDQVVALLHRPIFASLLLIGLWLAFQRFHPAPRVAKDVLSLLETVAILIWLVFLLRFVSLALAALSRLESRSALLEPRTVTLFDNLSKLIVVCSAIYALCLAWNLNVGAFLVGAGVAGLAIGLAAKDTLANVFSGIFIIADAPYQVGDYINLDSGERGMVTHIGLRSTRLVTRDDIEVTVPNAVIANGKIINESRGPGTRQRLRVRVGVAYGSDVDRVRSVLDAIAAEHPDVAEDPAPRTRFRGFGESGLDLELLAWIAEPELRGAVLDSLNTAIYKAFAREGIEIPYPKRDVYLRGTGISSPPPDSP
jgi:MscS family membrane protein